MYPEICYETLSAYVSTIQTSARELANASLSVSLNDELHQSMAAMKDLQGPDFEMKMSNVQTWVSAALINEDTCMDGMEGKAMNGKIKDTIRSNIGRVAQLTSNALAFINELSYCE
ncbi:21 kDa protein-like [Herrania umbratica]|uniref:21 kDa protein-like n=1 Tax=Herrania umbratica TaxID=108875 RepID=A0A6J1AI86_9ROSI|nr:21 kDa protein-like [Herrania umbratica]